MSEVSLESVLFAILTMCIVVNIAVTIYGVLFRPSLVKKLIALVVLGDSANVLAILIGFTMTDLRPEPPIIDDFVLKTSTQPSVLFVDPIPQALVLTAIVIGLAVYIVIASLIVIAYKFYGTTDVRKISKLRG